jgi:hypothetical protein
MVKVLLRTQIRKILKEEEEDNEPDLKRLREEAYSEPEYSPTFERYYGD